MLEETSLHCETPADDLAPAVPGFRRGNWYTLPSGKLVQVCRPQERNINVQLRYVDIDGVMETGCFEVCPWWLHRYGKPLGHAGKGKA